MTLQEQIKSDTIAAMKAKDKEKVSLLRVVTGEFNRVGKEVSDEQATGIIKKMVQNALEQGNTTEANILESYLPKQLTEDELRTIISNTAQAKGYLTMKDMGAIMGELKSTYSGQYDGKLASALVREILG